MPPALDTLDIETAAPISAAVIWMHGLGADAHDFEPLVPHLRLPGNPGLRFVFPNAPVQPVTVNGGMRMRAWYDILGIDIPARQDAAGVRASAAAIQALIEREIERGIPAARIVLAGFSQGGAMALHTGLRYPQRLAGILGLSCYLPLADSLADERRAANADVPILMTHGRFDQVIPLRHAAASRDYLETLGYRVEWHEYPMAHEVSLEEIQQIRDWLGRVLGTGTAE